MQYSRFDRDSGIVADGFDRISGVPERGVWMAFGATLYDCCCAQEVLLRFAVNIQDCLLKRKLRCLIELFADGFATGKLNLVVVANNFKISF